MKPKRSAHKKMMEHFCIFSLGSLATLSGCGRGVFAEHSGPVGLARNSNYVSVVPIVLGRELQQIESADLI